MRKFLNKLTCMALSLTFLMGCMATPAFAYSGEETGEAQYQTGAKHSRSCQHGNTLNQKFLHHEVTHEAIKTL